jgi:hypothetical protein
MVTGEERLVILGGGTAVKVKDAGEGDQTRRVATMGSPEVGNSITLAQIESADASLNAVRLPLVSGGLFLTVGDVRDFI